MALKKWKLQTILMLFLSLYYSSSLLTAKQSEWRTKVTCGPLTPSSSEMEGCYRRTYTIACPNISAVGTIVRKLCRFPYLLRKSERKEGSTYSCNKQGKWEHINHVCQPDCGKATSSNKYPWMVAIYDSDEKLVCSGAIISPYHVVTDANCIPVGYYVNKAVYYGNYTIVAGKHYTNIHRQRNSQQTRKIKYSETSKESNVLLLEVDKIFEFLDDVRPVCIDWQSFYEEWEYKDINDGIISGWEYDKDEMVPCSSVIHFWKRNICWENLYRDFREEFILAHDQSCAVYGDFMPTCAKYFDNMGLLFKPIQGRYFLRGIAGAPGTGWEKYIIYTKISSHFEWLKSKMKKKKKIFHFFLTFGKKDYENVGSCLLPQHIQYGKFSLATGKTYPNGTWVPANTVIFLTCNNHTESKRSINCWRKDWSPPIEKVTCTRAGSCPSLNSSESEDVFCKLNDESISCKNPPGNTTAVIVCQEFYALYGQKPVYKCQNGKWDPPFRSCSLECGTTRVGSKGFPTEITKAAINEFPWIVGIYKKNIQICAGTLISRGHILSAAHCFGDSRTLYQRTYDYRFVAGSYFNSLNNTEIRFQTRTEGTLYVHNYYDGPSKNYRYDIAVIELDSNFIVTLTVQPVCIDWENTFEDIDFIDGNMGVAAGWGFPDETGSPSYVLRKVAVPFQPKQVCLPKFPANDSYIHAIADKICAGYSNNNTNMCKNDGGAGLYFKSDGRRYFLRGIVSLVMKTEAGCEENHYTLYTKVSKYLSWIEMFTRKIL